MSSFNNSITISDVSFSYQKNKILEKVNLNIKKGTIVGIVGESGAGKKYSYKLNYWSLSAN
jgi:ABC-type multidrug transport system fused ATPase/permease subunit